MITKEEHERQMQLIECTRCRARKERSRFTEKSLKCSWSYWCISCENTPVGQLANQFAR